MTEIVKKLRAVAMAAPKEYHTQISKAMGISEAYSKKIRSGVQPINDTPRNRQLFSDMITRYEETISKHSNNLPNSMTRRRNRQ